MKTQQDIFNDNIIKQYEIRVSQDIDKIKKLEELNEELRKERDGWITEYRACRREIEKLKSELYDDGKNDSFEKIKEDALWEKIHALEDDLHNSETENDSLKDKVKALTMANDRVENDLTEAVEIMSSIYHKVDKYYLNVSFNEGQLYEKLKEYLGK